MIRVIALVLVLVPGAAAAAGDAFFSLRNPDSVVTTAFLIFIGVLLYFRVPSMAGRMLGNRADSIRGELDEARRLRDEAQEMLASYERKQAEVRDQADRIVANAREEAELAAEQAEKRIEASIERRLKAAEDQIASAESAAMREISDSAIDAATAAVRDVLRQKMTAQRQNAIIDKSIADIGTRLN